MKRVCTLLALMPISGVSAGVEPYTCTNGSFPSFERIQYAEISGSKNTRSYFYDDEKGCPEKSSCMRKSYLVKGDKVLFSEIGDDHWVCVWYFGKRHEHIGLMDRSNFNLLQEKTPSLQDWTGTWRPTAGNNEIRIKILPNGRLSVSGNASWYSGKDGYNEEIVHEGDMSGDGIPTGNRLVIGNPNEAYDCVVRFQLIQGNLAVADNGNCGGMNVSFDDVYRLLAKGVPDLPSDARQVADRLASCSHFAGEFNGDGSDRDKEVASTMAELRCDTIDKDVSAIRQKYTGNWTVQEALAAASEL